MALIKVKYNNEEIYIQDELTDEETGIFLSNEDDLDKTLEFNFSDEFDLLGDTQEFKFDFHDVEGE